MIADKKLVWISLKNNEDYTDRNFKGKAISGCSGGNFSLSNFMDADVCGWFADCTFAFSFMEDMLCEQVVFENCKFLHTDASGSRFSEATFEDCEFIGGNFKDTLFVDCEFKGCSLVALYARNARFENCKFEDCGDVNGCFVDAEFDDGCEFDVKTKIVKVEDKFSKR